MEKMQTLRFVKKEVPYWTAGSAPVPGVSVRRVSSGWSRTDYIGMIRSRIGAFRMNYSVAPGLYAVGQPSPQSDVKYLADVAILKYDDRRRTAHPGLDRDRSELAAQQSYQRRSASSCCG
jgi:hypothetical protein